MSLYALSQPPKQPTPVEGNIGDLLVKGLMMF
jgi:hypothetical protein